MSILDEVERLSNRGLLELLEPIGPRAHLIPEGQRRRLYVTSDLARYFEHPRSLSLYADLNVYILGQDINVAIEPDHTDCRMARLHPARDDVWEIRYFEREPQLRLFGRFATTDVFVALRGPVRRNEIKRRGFDRLRDECLADWRTLFGWNPPEILGSNDEHDYISQNVHLIEHS
jgi:hypothetical protein